MTAVSAALVVGTWLFWWLLYPHALSYQEQYQLFLWSGDYLAERLSVPGGLADWLGELIVQFYYVEWLGALLLGGLFWLIHQAAWRALRSLSATRRPWLFYVSLLPPLFLLWLMGDESVLLSLPVAVLMALGAAALMGRLSRGPAARAAAWADVLMLPALYWLAGPVVWLYVLLRVGQQGWRHLWAAPWMAAVQFAAYAWLLPQWPLPAVLWGQGYYRTPLAWPRMAGGFDSEKYELIREDYLVRHERWDELIERAKTRQVRTPFSSVCVNLALAQKRQLADRMFDFYQSGEDALLMPRVRDLTSMLPTAEAFWRLGMVNSAQRYMFDTQESILNGRNSGRCTKRIAECMIVNGHYQTARKQLALLKQSLFYRSWALEAEALLGQEQLIAAHPVYGRLRQLRYKEDFLYSHAEIDKMLGLLFMNNHDNKMALDYFLGQLLLKGDVQGFANYLQWAQQYGGYNRMPLGYQDAVNCIRERGNVQGSPYGNYVRQMTERRRQP